MRGRLPKVGTYAGTGVLLQVNLGFNPRAVLFYDETDGTIMGLAINGQADGAGFKSYTSGAGVTNNSAITTNGITFGSEGFSVGTDAQFNINGKTYRFIAF